MSMEFPTLDAALRGMLSAGPAERAIRNSWDGTRWSVTVFANAIVSYRKNSGEYHLNNKFRYLIAHV